MMVGMPGTMPLPGTMPVIPSTILEKPPPPVAILPAADEKPQVETKVLPAAAQSVAPPPPILPQIPTYSVAPTTAVLPLPMPPMLGGGLLPPPQPLPEQPLPAPTTTSNDDRILDQHEFYAIQRELRRLQNRRSSHSPPSRRNGRFGTRSTILEKPPPPVAILPAADEKPQVETKVLPAAAQSVAPPPPILPQIPTYSVAPTTAVLPLPMPPMLGGGLLPPPQPLPEQPLPAPTTTSNDDRILDQHEFYAIQRELRRLQNRRSSHSPPSRRVRRNSPPTRHHRGGSTRRHRARTPPRHRISRTPPRNHRSSGTPPRHKSSRARLERKVRNERYSEASLSPPPRQHSDHSAVSGEEPVVREKTKKEHKKKKSKRKESEETPKNIAKPRVASPSPERPPTPPTSSPPVTATPEKSSPREGTPAGTPTAKGGETPQYTNGRKDDEVSLDLNQSDRDVEGSESESRIGELKKKMEEVSMKLKLKEQKKAEKKKKKKKSKDKGKDSEEEDEEEVKKDKKKKKKKHKKKKREEELEEGEISSGKKRKRSNSSEPEKEDQEEEKRKKKKKKHKHSKETSSKDDSKEEVKIKMNFTRIREMDSKMGSSDRRVKVEVSPLKKKTQKKKSSKHRVARQAVSAIEDDIHFGGTEPIRYNIWRHSHLVPSPHICVCGDRTRWLCRQWTVFPAFNLVPYKINLKYAILALKSNSYFCYSLFSKWRFLNFVRNSIIFGGTEPIRYNIWRHSHLVRSPHTHMCGDRTRWLCRQWTVFPAFNLVPYKINLKYAILALKSNSYFCYSLFSKWRFLNFVRNSIIVGFFEVVTPPCVVCEFLFAHRKLVLALTSLFLDQFRQTKVLRSHKIMLFPVICGFFRKMRATKTQHATLTFSAQIACMSRADCRGVTSETKIIDWYYGTVTETIYTLRRGPAVQSPTKKVDSLK
eukprot:sb/3461789/